MNRALQNLALRAYGAASRVVPLHQPPFSTIYSRAYFAYKRLAEDALAKVAKKRPELFRGGNIIDAGANIGYTALLFARHIDPRFAVHAFEPDARNAAMLRRNTRGKPVVVHECALGATRGRARLWLNRDHPADHRIVTPAFEGETVDVDIVRADDVVPSPVVFVKIDVQGFELEVSRGLTSLLDRNQRIAVAFEYAPELLAEKAQPLLDFYLSRGFQLTPLGKGDYYDILAVRS
jgi:FkbM family methyltransferase